MDFFGARDPRKAVEGPLRLAGMRGPRSLPVIASAAKQSTPPRKERMDCFVARAPRNDVENPLRLAGIRRPHSLPVIASASEAIHAATERKHGLLRRSAPRNDGVRWSDGTKRSR